MVLPDGVDPYQILGVSKQFDIEELKSAFKKIAVKVHPDKGGNEYMFNLVTECFKTLMREWKRRTSDKTHDELRSSYKQYSEKTRSNKPVINDDDYDYSRASAGTSFDLNKFNQLYVANRKETVADIGYDDWYKEEIKNNIPKLKGSSKEAFNKHFEKHVKVTTANTSKEVSKYVQPAPLTSTKLQCVELGTDTINDFSGEGKRLNYMDLKIAHSTSRIIDPSTVNRKEYRNLDELERDRSNISHQISPEEHEYLEKLKQIEEKNEMIRLQRLQKHDTEAEIHYNRVHNLLKHMRQ